MHQLEVVGWESPLRLRYFFEMPIRLLRRIMSFIWIEWSAVAIQAMILLQQPHICIVNRLRRSEALAINFTAKFPPQLNNDSEELTMIESIRAIVSSQNSILNAIEH